MSIKATRGDSYSILICLFPCLLSFQRPTSKFTSWRTGSVWPRRRPSRWGSLWTPSTTRSWSSQRARRGKWCRWETLLSYYWTDWIFEPEMKCQAITKMLPSRPPRGKLMCLPNFMAIDPSFDLSVAEISEKWLCSHQSNKRRDISHWVCQIHPRGTTNVSDKMSQQSIRW